MPYTIQIVHPFHSAKSDGADPAKVQATNWNANLSLKVNGANVSQAYDLLGTANQITVSGGTGQLIGGANATFSLPGALTLPGNVTITGQTATTVPYLDANKTLTSSSVTPTELGYVSGVTSALQTQLGNKYGSGSNASLANLTLSGQTATTVPYLDASKLLVSSAVTPTELGYVSGVTSAIQTQISAKYGSGSSASHSNLTLTGQTATTVPYLDASKLLVSSAVTPTELGYVSGVTSALQTQLGNKYGSGANATLANLTLSGQTATTVPYFDASKLLVSSAITPTELGRLSGITGSIMTLVNGRAPNTQTGTSYTLVLTDAGVPVTMNNASASTVTLPDNANVAFSNGTMGLILQLGAGNVTLAGGPGVTIKAFNNSLTSAGQNGALSWMKLDTTTYFIWGVTG